MDTFARIAIGGLLGHDASQGETKDNGRTPVRLRIATHKGSGSNRKTTWHNVTWFAPSLGALDAKMPRLLKGAKVYVEATVDTYNDRLVLEANVLNILGDAPGYEHYGRAESNTQEPYGHGHASHEDDESASHYDEHEEPAQPRSRAQRPQYPSRPAPPPRQPAPAPGRYAGNPYQDEEHRRPAPQPSSRPLQPARTSQPAPAAGPRRVAAKPQIF